MNDCAEENLFPKENPQNRKCKLWALTAVLPGSNSLFFWFGPTIFYQDQNILSPLQLIRPGLNQLEVYPAN